MANQFDLEEQEQLDQIKHFWKQYGNIITWILIAVMGLYASWNFYNYWQRSQAMQAAALFDEVERSVQSTDAAKMDRVFADMKDRFGSTTYAQQSGLLVARQHVLAGNTDAAKQALGWVAQQSSDAGYQAIAKLRLAAILIDAKDYDGATAQLTGSFPASFEPLMADRKGDLLLAKGDAAAAKEEYKKAYRLMDAGNQYRRLVEVKLNSLGVEASDDKQLAATAGK